MKKLLLLSISALLYSCQISGYKGKVITLIPIPQNIQYFDENGFVLSDTINMSYDNNARQAALLLEDYLKNIGFKIKYLDLNEKGRKIILRLNNIKDSTEGYTLKSSEKQLIAEANSKQGLLNAVQTIRQICLSEYNGKTIQLPSFSILDYPRFKWRGMLLDCCRHFMEKDFVKRYIDLLALHKFNRLHWHLTEDQGWRIEIKSYPKLTEIGAWRKNEKGEKYGGFYTQDDIKEIVKYAAERGIVVVPEIELPGHAQAALASYPHFSCTGGPFDVTNEWGVFKEIYCAGNDSTFSFLNKVLDEVLEMFPSPYIHIGGDEVPKYRWSNCKKCQKRIKDQGLKDEHELQSYFIGRINKYLQSKGRTLIGWDEIMEGGLVENAIVQSWRGFEGAKSAAEKGHAAIVSPTSHAYFDYGLQDIDLEKVYQFNPIPKGLAKKHKHLILGAECNMWTERAPQDKVDSKVFPRILAMAEVLWTNPEKADYQKFKSRVQKHYKVLDKSGVNYGMETLPLKIKTSAVHDGTLVEFILQDNALKAFYRIGNQKEKPYSDKFVIKKPDSVCVRFERNGKEIDYNFFQILKPHLAVNKLAEIKHEVNEQYKSDILDSKKGSSSFKDGNWQGSWGNDMEVTIDLGSEKKVAEISAGFLQYNNAWIFLPEEVEFFVAKGDKVFTSIGKIKNNISPKLKEELTKDFLLKFITTEARFIKMRAKSIGPCPDWHDAAGSKSWLFLDEISVN
jgi:hexosaminidase